MPAAGIPFQRLALRSLRTVERDAHSSSTRSAWAPSVPQAAAILARWRPAAIFTTGGYVADPGAAGGRLRCASRACCGRAT